MSDHILVLEVSNGWARGHVECRASADAECRALPDCMCESWSDVGRDDQGWFHVYTTWDDDDNERDDIHRHSPSSECNVCNWLNADDPIELQRGKAVTATIEIEPVWADEGYEWEPA